MKFMSNIFCISMRLMQILANEGKCESGNCENGKGVFVFSDGRKYDGNFKNKEMDGAGILYFKNENVYEGDFLNNRIEGKGRYTFVNGDIYTGELKDGKFEGRGIFFTKDLNWIPTFSSVTLT